MTRQTLNEFKPYVRECAFWSKRVPKHTYETASLRTDYCSKRCWEAAKAQRRRDKKFLATHPRWTLADLGTEHVYLPKQRRKVREKPPLVGSTKYPDLILDRQTPDVNRCPTCGAWTGGGNCAECSPNWL